MKTIQRILLCTSLMLALPFISQAQLVDILPEDPSDSHIYYPNEGQLIDQAGNLVPDILYYTDRTSPAMFFAEDWISLAFHKVDTTFWNNPDTTRSDTSYRLDMRFVCSEPAAVRSEETCGEIVTSEPGSDYLNYYYPHCPQGITEVSGFHRIEYQNAFDDIDVHFYSNTQGLKMYFVVHPGGNPSDIELEFQGQDSMGTLINGQLEAYLRDQRWSFPQATAYQVSGGAASSLSWLPLWYEDSPGHVKISTGNYNDEDQLIIRVAWPQGAQTTTEIPPISPTAYTPSPSKPQTGQPLPSF